MDNPPQILSPIFDACVISSRWRIGVFFAGSTLSGSGVTTGSRREGGGALATGFAGGAVEVCAITGMAAKQSTSVRAVPSFMDLSFFGPGFFAALTGESTNPTEG